MTLTAREMLSYRALNRKLLEIEKQGPENSVQMGKKNGKLKKELEAARKTFARIKKGGPGNETSQGTKRRKT